MADDLVMARIRFISFHEGNGRPVVVEHRAVARKGHPVVAAQPDMWVPLAVDFDVEADPERMADDASPEVQRLKQELVGLGVDVDGRWTLARLRKEAAKARKAKEEAEA